MRNLEVLLSEAKRLENLERPLETMPFGAQYLEKPKIDAPGEVYAWTWQPRVKVNLGNKTNSWPGTTGTGPRANEDEVYGESG